jgi:hypothetical protein
MQKKTNTEKWSLELSQTILATNYLNEKDLESLILTSLKMEFQTILNDYNSKEDDNLLRLNQEALKTHGTPAYAKVGLEISLCKSKRARAYRASKINNNVSKFNLLKKFLLEKGGESIFEEFSKTEEFEKLSNTF